MPGVLDRYLARTGYKSQQTDEPEDPNRPHNLWEPVPGDFGAHGNFDSRAHDRSLQLWATTHRFWFAVALAGLAGVGMVAYSALSDRDKDAEESNPQLLRE
jgi:hypothetical protein